MELSIKSLRTFIGAVDFSISRSFYRELGFDEIVIDSKMSLFRKQEFAFYLQDYSVKEWLENTMLFIEVENAQQCFEWLQRLNLEKTYSGVKLLPVRKAAWGQECFLLDPSGVLLHFGHFEDRA